MKPADLTYTTFIKSTPEKVWSAITNPEFSRQYWGGKANVSDWQIGSIWQHQDEGNNNVRITGKVLESDPPRRLALSWFSPNNEADVSRVTFDIQSVAGIVRLDVVHSEFTADSNMVSGVSKGWPVVLASMKSYIETGSGFDVMAALNGCESKQEAAA